MMGANITRSVYQILQTYYSPAEPGKEAGGERKRAAEKTKLKGSEKSDEGGEDKQDKEDEGVKESLVEVANSSIQYPAFMYM